MNVQAITQRLLVSASSDNSVRSMLMAFGITNATKTTLPSVFDPKYDAEWQMFIEMSDFAAPDYETRLLYTVLEFIRYMRYNKRNPFIRPVTDPISRKPLNLEKVYRRLVEDQVKAKMLEMDRRAKKYGLLNLMSIKSSKVFATVKNDAVSVTVYSALTPKRPGDKLDSVVQKLQGTLYSGKIPVQLLDKLKPGSDKSNLMRPDDLMVNQPATFGWWKLFSDKTGSQAVTRSVNGLVFRTTVSFKLYVEVGTTTATKSFIEKTWKALKTADIL